jgi:bifunctional non-homologous end joining protein LigD
MSKKPLEEYKKKRNFGTTPEPLGKKSQKTTEKPVFVIQKHNASRLHYDLRLESEGVLASWAIPKGPSTDPEQKRLAVRTEDHPFEYRNFEGIIPEGEYGAGQVIIWDTGTYSLIGEKSKDAESPSRAIEKGHISFNIEGKKLKGGFSLTRIDDKGKWLLVKMRDSEANSRDNLLKEEPDSAVSGKSIENLKKD